MPTKPSYYAYIMLSSSSSNLKIDCLEEVEVLITNLGFKVSPSN